MCFHSRFMSCLSDDSISLLKASYHGKVLFSSSGLRPLRMSYGAMMTDTFLMPTALTRQKTSSIAPHLVIAHPHDSVLDPATRPAATAFEICFANLHRLLLAGVTLPEQSGNIVDEKMMFGETSRAPEPISTGLSHRRWNQIHT